MTATCESLSPQGSDGGDSRLGVLRRKYNPNSARPRIFDGVAEAKLIALTLTPAPEGFARWSLRLLEEKVVELHIVVGERHEPEDISPSSLPVRWSVGGVSAWLSDRIGRRLNFILYEVGSIAIVIAYTQPASRSAVPDRHAWLGPRVQL